MARSLSVIVNDLNAVATIDAFRARPLDRWR
jgi:hypothetical protein